MSLSDAQKAAFWAKVQKGAPDECWPWTGYVKPSGHGLSSYLSTSIHAHRKAWIIVNGPIRDESLCVNHRCDNKLCCNPAHMYLGTRADNMIDFWGKEPGEERGPRGRNHVLTDEQMAELRADRLAGKTLKECAAKYGVHIATICRHVTVMRWAVLRRLRAERLARTSRPRV